MCAAATQPLAPAIQSLPPASSLCPSLGWPSASSERALAAAAATALALPAAGALLALRRRWRRQQRLHRLLETQQPLAEAHEQHAHLARRSGLSASKGRLVLRLHSRDGHRGRRFERAQPRHAEQPVHVVPARRWQSWPSRVGSCQGAGVSANPLDEHSPGVCLHTHTRTAAMSSAYAERSSSSAAGVVRYVRPSGALHGGAHASVENVLQWRQARCELAGQPR